MSPTLGVASLTVLASARSACCGVSVALASLLLPFGSNWSASVTIAVLVRGAGLTTVATIASVCGVAGRDGADGPHAGDAVVGALAGGRRHEGQARRQAGR